MVKFRKVWKDVEFLYVLLAQRYLKQWKSHNRPSKSRQCAYNLRHWAYKPRQCL